MEKAALRTRRLNKEDPTGDRPASLKAEVDALPFDFDPDQADPAQFLGEIGAPLAIHHAEGDPVVPFEWSEATAAELENLGHTVVFYRYPSSHHLFESDEFEQAIERDVAFFRQQTK